VVGVVGHAQNGWGGITNPGPLHPLVPKLQLGNAVFEAPASRETTKQELARHGFPSRSLGTSQKMHVLLMTGQIMTTSQNIQSVTRAGRELLLIIGIFKSKKRFICTTMT